MRWILDPATRDARWRILKLRWSVLRYGDDFAETMSAALATVYGVVLLLPGDTTGKAQAWRVLREAFNGDVGMGLFFTALAVPLWLGAFRLIPDRVRAFTFLATFSVWVGMAVGFFLGYPWSLGPYVSALYAVTAWIAYLRADE